MQPHRCVIQKNVFLFVAQLMIIVQMKLISVQIVHAFRINVNMDVATLAVVALNQNAIMRKNLLIC